MCHHYTHFTDGDREVQSGRVMGLWSHGRRQREGSNLGSLGLDSVLHHIGRTWQISHNGAPKTDVWQVPSKPPFLPQSL